MLNSFYYDFTFNQEFDIKPTLLEIFVIDNNFDVLS